ncbi:MAG: metallophosphoesterase [Actinomycetota bacterium]
MFAWIAGVLGFGVVCVLYGVCIEHRWFRITRHRLDILPADAPAPITVLHLSDLHFTVREPRKIRFIAALPKADITVVTGDFLAEPAAVETVVAALKPALGTRASWFVLGSNDYFVPRRLNYFSYFRRDRHPRRTTRGRAGDLRAQLAATGWEDLTNVRRQIQINDLPMELLGLDDAHIFWHDLTVAPRTEPERFGFAVMHSPDSAPETAALGYDLMVAGHTHGGQVRLPWVGALVTNCSMPRRLVSGLIRMGGAVMYLSPGMGTSKFAPFRFFCRPEAALLELRPRKS